MNVTECENLIKSVKWTEPSNLISLAILEFINVLVIGGNCLVIAAVFCSNKLRSVTNFFIVNLAVADLLVGLAVLPFSATWEVFKVWIFGDVWCRIWLAVDVWMCTASILNLCAISLDRYVAVTRPVTYPSIMSTKKAKSLIAGIWVLSFVICFPPLVGWKDQKPVVPSSYIRGNYTFYYASSTTAKTTSSSSSSSPTLTHAQQQPQLKIQNNSNLNSGELTSASSSYIPYNPYDPSFAPLDDEFYTSAESILHPDNSAAVTLTAPRTTNTPIGTPHRGTYAYSPEPVNDFDYESGLGAPPQIHQGPPPACPWKCELTNDRGYVLYSALGSFYIPMFVMLFFYWRIYRAAVRTTRAINQGFKTTKGNPHETGSTSGGTVDDSRLVLRIHRGRPCSTPQRTPLSLHSMSSTLSVNSNGYGGHEESFPLQQHEQTSTPKRATSMRLNRQRHEKVAIKVSFPSSENVLNSVAATSPPRTYSVVARGSSCSTKSALSNGRRASFKTSLFEIGETTFNLDAPSKAVTCPRDEGTVCGSVGTEAASGSSSGGAGNIPRDVVINTSTTKTVASSSVKEKKRSGKRSAKFQVKRFRMETKAAKTLAIIVGGFIVCWLPFFTMYLIRAFCEQCIQPTVFSVLFWLGYCNSAINPLIYALFSNEFRIAFKRIICRCVCTRSGFRASENFQMIAARALMAPATFHKTISGCSDDGDGVDFS